MSEPEDGELSDTQKTNVLAAFKRHSNLKDEIQFFDPMLSAVGPPGRQLRVCGGYKLWPDEAYADGADLTLMTIGNSTSLWPYYEWSLELGEMLSTDARRVELWHGAGKGSTSSQEVMRVLRDAPAIKPDMIVALSGICDIGYLLNSPTHPFLHKYMRRVLDFALDAGIVTRNLVNGPKHYATPAEVWCRNQRFARVLADEMGITLLSVLQPVQGYGDYPWTDAEKAFYESKASVVLKAIGKPYGTCVQEFYTQIKEIIAERPQAFDHVVDFTGVFDDCPGAYKDHRHQTPLGGTHLARKLEPVVEAALAKGTHS